MTTFLDTSGVLALLDADDAHHPEADAVWNKLILANEPLVSSNYVLVELIALVQRRLGMEAVQTIYNVLVPLLEVEWIDREIHEAASADLVRAWRRRLSLVDCSSFVVMRKLGLTKVFAFDGHFPEHGFEQIPAQASADSAPPGYFEGGEPVLPTRQDKISGLFVPLEDPDQIPDDLRRELISTLGRYISGVLESQGVPEEEILKDYNDLRRRR